MIHLEPVTPENWPAAVRNAVGDVQEAAVIEIVIIPENGFFKNLRVQL